MKNKILLAVIIIVFGSLVNSCVKDGHVSLSSSKECIIKGRIVKDCGGTPLANYSLSIYQKSDFLGNTGGVRGTGSTDANGYYSIHIANLNSMSVEIEHEDGNPNHGPDHIFDVYKTLQYGSSSINDLGVYYLETVTNIICKINLNRTFALGDTILFGIPSDLRILPVTNTTDIEVFSWSGSGYAFNRPDTIAMIWGIGKKDYDSAYNCYTYPGAYGYHNPPYHVTIAKVAVCAQPDTTFITIQ